MSTEIKTWQITGDSLNLIETTMAESGRKERELEKWLLDGSDLLGDDIAIIGEQVPTRSGPADFLGVDTQGNVVVIELKRDKLEREVVAQAIDYASDVASWEAEKLDAICRDLRKKGLEEYRASLPSFGLPDAVTNRIFSVKIHLEGKNLSLFSRELIVRPLLISSGKQVGGVGMVVDADLDRTTGCVKLQPGKPVTVAFLLSDESVPSLRIVVQDPTTDAELYRSPSDIPVRLGV